jgi:hypothetical protein
MAGFIVGVIILLITQAFKNNDYKKKVRENDNNPYCSIKSDPWLKQHPEWKGRI